MSTLSVIELRFIPLFLIAMIVPTSTGAMKGSVDSLKPAVSASRFPGILSVLPEESLVWGILSVAKKKDLKLVCKAWRSIFSVGNWEEIVEKQPMMIARYPLDCQRVYYLCIADDKINPMEALLGLDGEIQNNITSLYEKIPSVADKILCKEPSARDGMRVLLEPHHQQEKVKKYTNQLYTYLDSDCEGTLPVLHKFTRAIMHNNKTEMELLLEQYDQNTIDKIIRLSHMLLGRYASPMMYEVLWCRLNKPIKYIDLEDSYSEMDQSYGVSPFIGLAACGYRIDIVELLLSRGANVNDTTFACPIEGACQMAHEKGDYRLLSLLADYNINVNDTIDDICYDGGTFERPLGKAIEVGNLRLVSTLIIMGGNPFRCGPDSQTPGWNLAQLARNSGHQDIIDIIKMAQKQWIKAHS